jgi:hypothetical protein
MKCKVCNKDYQQNCDFRQGRCPQHPPLLNISTFINLIKGKVKSWQLIKKNKN